MKHWVSHFQFLTLRCWTDFSKKMKRLFGKYTHVVFTLFFQKYINTLGSQRCCWAENRAITESECKLSKRPKLQRRKTLVIYSSGQWNLIKNFSQWSQHRDHLFKMSACLFWFDLFLEARAEVLTKISLVFWSIWGHFKINWPLKLHWISLSFYIFCQCRKMSIYCHSKSIL